MSKFFSIVFIPFSLLFAKIETYTISNVAIDIYHPSHSCSKNILLLPGWSYSRKDWHQKTDLLSYAEKKRYCLAFPEMGKAIYASRYFKETTRKVFDIPPQRWFQQRFFPEMQRRFSMFKKNQSNYILGLSTGGRGAALIALSYQSHFEAIASLSGDYNQYIMPKDKLMAKVYGSYKYFKHRWMYYDNPYYRSYQWRLPLYLGHGSKDTVVAKEQTTEFYKKLTKLHPKVDIKLHIAKNSQHNYQYWNSELTNVFQFFEKHKK